MEETFKIPVKRGLDLSVRCEADPGLRKQHHEGASEAAREAGRAEVVRREVFAPSAKDPRPCRHELAGRQIDPSQAFARIHGRFDGDVIPASFGILLEFLDSGQQCGG